MLLAISDRCSQIVERFGPSWPFIGWGLWIGGLCGPFLLLPLALTFSTFQAFVVLSWVLFVLLYVWWLLDVVDQQVAAWQVVVGLVMLGIGRLPMGGLLSIACWVTYWTKVRE
jgi:hypothetical protein